MNIICIGGGPAGIYLAISLKLRAPEHHVSVFEARAEAGQQGWGIVLSDQTMEMLTSNDPVSAKAIQEALVRWDDINISLRGRDYRSSGHGFVGIDRTIMLQSLYQRARELGVNICFGKKISPQNLEQQFPAADLIVAADGLHSALRDRDREGFQCDIDVRPNKFIWLGTAARFDEAFRFIFEETSNGLMMAHGYQYAPGKSTFIIECTEDVFARTGFGTRPVAETVEQCTEIFAKHLQGQRLQAQSGGTEARWRSFPRVYCGRWAQGKVVLIGDAAHSAHFSIGSGTRMAFEDAVCLAEKIAGSGYEAMSDALQGYQQVRQLDALRLQSAARNAMEWFENVEKRYYQQLPPLQFVYSCLTRSQRVSHENLRLRDPKGVAAMESDFADHAARAVDPKAVHQRADDKSDRTRAAQRERDGVSTVLPMFTPYRLRDMVVENRVAVSPMSMYSADDGAVGDWHLVHYGARASGGAGLVFTEMTDVSREGRITPGCAGLYKDEHIAPWKRIVDYVHRYTRAKIAVQLGHAGRKGSTRVIWDGHDQPLAQENWALIAPSALPWDKGSQTPRAMTMADMDYVCEAFVAATLRADAAGFDMIELHAAHGYLLSSFLTPLSNKRDDEYGGSLENRLRFPLRIFHAVRDVWPSHKPMSVRLSATDWHKEGLGPQEACLISRAFVEAGADIIDVSAGHTVPLSQTSPVYGRMYQTPLSDQIRNEAGVATMAVGNIYEADHVNSILAAGRADLVLIGRPHLLDPYWTLRAAAAAGYSGAGITIPKQYQPGFDQLETILKREADMVTRV
ncbi:MAG: oxidoreductase [Kordiimonas sp.]|nr:oxidoreductase [Kordiimonas sp.]